MLILDFLMILQEVKDELMVQQNKIYLSKNMQSEIERLVTRDHFSTSPNILKHSTI